MIAVIDYGMGNLRSVQKALERSGAKAIVTQDSNEIEAAQAIVLPGVGAMKPAMERLNELELVDTIKKAVADSKPFLGICLGFQLLFETSDEGGEVYGLGLIKGNVKRFNQLKVPQIGWNQIIITKKNCPLFHGIKDTASVYFCHSYYAVPAQPSDVATTTDYGIEYASGVWKDNIFGVQFHPEKSQAIGLTLLKNFIESTR